MAHQSLYRAYRPDTFADVLGQEQVTKPLAEAAKSGAIGHAYLFSGSRGLGKTSVARIFAKAIGCKETDLTEIDAASNNSVEDIRALAEGVYTLPFESPYKVYILDEVHMLSKGAWNAFLKTLEEPPTYAVFILATTEMEKVPETVRSRCQVFEFKKPMRKGLAQMATAVAKKEGYTLDTDAADLIAMLGDGSYRDTLSVLQKALAGADGKTLSRETVEETTGAPKREHVYALIGALAAGNKSEALTAVEKAADSDVDMKLFLELVLGTLRNTLLLRHAPELRAMIGNELGDDELAQVEGFAKEAGITHDTMLAFLTAADRIRFAPIPALPLELAVLEALPE